LILKTHGRVSRNIEIKNLILSKILTTNRKNSKKNGWSKTL